MTCNLNEFRGFHGANKSCSGDTPATRIYFFESHQSVVNINEEEEGHSNAVSCLTLLLGSSQTGLWQGQAVEMAPRKGINKGT